MRPVETTSTEGVRATSEGSRIACIGLRAKTARAIAVVISGTVRSPHAVTRAQLVLGTPDTPALFQPYHEVMDLPWDRATMAVAKAERAIEAVAIERLRSLLLDVRARKLDVVSVAIVGAPDRNPGAIGSPHIRAHAAEGVLFRRVWQVAADAVRVRSTAFPEKGFEALAAARLGLPVGAVRERLAEFGHALGRPWRADEKAAAMAAWIGLGATRRGG